MATIFSNETEQLRQEYQARVTQFYQLVAQCLADRYAIRYQLEQYQDVLGQYEGSKLQLFDSASTETPALELFPLGASSLFGEGMLAVSSTMWEESLVYFSLDNIPTVAYETAKPVALFQGIQHSGWYWLAHQTDTQAVFIHDCASLQRLLTAVT